MSHLVDGALIMGYGPNWFCPATVYDRRNLAVMFRISRDLIMAESKGLVWCTDDNPLRLVYMLEWTWSMGHLFWDLLYI